MGLEEIKNLIKGGIFQSPSKGALDLTAVINELIGFKKENPEDKYRIAIGTDSEVKDIGIEFVCVIAIHRIGKGGRYFWFKIYDKTKIDLRTRIYQEAVVSLALAGALLEKELEMHGIDVTLDNPVSKAFKALENEINGNSEREIIFTNELEIHVDIGTVGPTREMIREIVGMVKGSGFFVKIKPDSFAATSLADKQL